MAREMQKNSMFIEHGPEAFDNGAIRKNLDDDGREKRTAMEIIEIEEVRSLDFPVKRHRSVLQALLRRKITKKSKHRASEKEVRSSTEFHDPLNFLIMILLNVLGVSFNGSGISPLREHDKITLFFIMIIAIYSIVFLGIKLGPQNATYLPMFKFICVICAILSCELLASILVNPLKLIIINICGFLVELIRRSWYKLIYELLCHATNNLELLDFGEAVGTQSRGLSQDLINLLPTSKYKFKNLFSAKKARERCVVCQMRYKRGDRQIKLPCKHVYHSECITKWLSISKICPICNTEVFG